MRLPGYLTRSPTARVSTQALVTIGIAYTNNKRKITYQPIMTYEEGSGGYVPRVALDEKGDWTTPYVPHLITPLTSEDAKFVHRLLCMCGAFACVKEYVSIAHGADAHIIADQFLHSPLITSFDGVEVKNACSNDIRDGIAMITGRNNLLCKVSGFMTYYVIVTPIKNEERAIPEEPYIVAASKFIDYFEAYGIIQDLELDEKFKWAKEVWRLCGPELWSFRLWRNLISNPDKEVLMPG